MVGTGVAATHLYSVGGQTPAGGGGDSLLVFELSQHFVTLMDSLKLNMRAVDELHPTLKELQSTISIPTSHILKSYFEILIAKAKFSATARLVAGDWNNWFPHFGLGVEYRSLVAA